MKRKINSFTFIVVVFWGFVVHHSTIFFKKALCDDECRLTSVSGVSCFSNIPETASLFFLSYNDKMTHGQFSQSRILSKINSAFHRII